MVRSVGYWVLRIGKSRVEGWGARKRDEVVKFKGRKVENNAGGEIKRQKITLEARQNAENAVEVKHERADKDLEKGYGGSQRRYIKPRRRAEHKSSLLFQTHVLGWIS